MVANAAARHRVVVAPNLSGIPGEMGARPQWVTHKNGAPCSVCTGRPTDYTKPENFARFEEACATAAERGHDGPGYCLLADDPFSFVDVDHCVRADGTIAPLVLNLLLRLGTYVQYSMNDGVHAILRARKPVTDCVFWLTDPASGEKFKVEVYDRDRYIRMTGRTPVGMPTQIAEAQEALDALIAELDARPGARAKANGHARPQPDPAQAGRPSQPEGSASMEDDELVERARRLEGRDGTDVTQYMDHGVVSGSDDSDADWAFCKILGKLAQDTGQIDRIVRCSALMRAKWDEPRGSETYGARTIRLALEELALERVDGEQGHAGADVHDHHGDADGHEQAQCSAGTDEVAELRRQLAAARQALAAKTAEADQAQQALAAREAIIATQRQVIADKSSEGDTYKRAHARALALLMTPALTECQKKALVHHLEHQGYAYGLPVPTGVWWHFLTDQDMQASGISKDSYYTANVVLEDVGLFERERREPTSPPQEALDEEDAGDEARSSGRPYDMWRIVPAAVERFMAALEVGEQPAPPKRQEAEREKRRAKEKQAKAEREAHEARLRQEVQAAVQVKYDLKQARQEAEERSRALEEARRVIADHQRRSPENLGCRECGTKLDPEHLLCDECRQREQEQAPDQLCGTVPPPGNVPRLPGGERGLKGTVPINPPDGQEPVRGTRGPPGYAPADDAVARGMCTACTECKGRTGARLYRIGEKYFCSCQWPDPWEAAASAWGLRP